VTGALTYGLKGFLKKWTADAAAKNAAISAEVAEADVAIEKAADKKLLKKL